MFFVTVSFYTEEDGAIQIDGIVDEEKDIVSDSQWVRFKWRNNSGTLIIPITRIESIYVEPKSK